MPEPTGETAAVRDSQDGYLPIKRKILLASAAFFRSNLGMKIQASFRFILLFILALFSVQIASAGSATWKSNPESDDWGFDPNNWTPATIPNGVSDTATFATSTITAISITAAPIELEGIVFQPGASSYSFSAANINFEGTGITNNSGLSQSFLGGDFQFFNSATAGNAVSITSGTAIRFYNTSSAGSATITGNNDWDFHDTSSADNATLIDNASLQFEDSASAGTAILTNNDNVFFEDTTTAESASITNNASASAFPTTYFDDDSTAANCNITNIGADGSGMNEGRVFFSFRSSAGNATVIAKAGLNGGQGGIIFFFDNASGGTARLETFGDGIADDPVNGRIDLASHNGRITLGSVEGAGQISLGGNSVTVGANNLSTIFTGVITDNGITEPGALVKAGRGKLTLATPSIYLGGTTVSQGVLLVTNRAGSGSATGTGAVSVTGGTLGGNGKISGAVTIGTATRAGKLAPGISVNPAILTLRSTLTFNSAGQYEADIKSTIGTADRVLAAGVTINSGATISLIDRGGGILASGTVLTIISNTAATPIAGTFTNLPDGATITVGSNTFQANYEGGDGNDLTLTVIQ